MKSLEVLVVNLLEHYGFFLALGMALLFTQVVNHLERIGPLCIPIAGAAGAAVLAIIWQWLRRLAPSRQRGVRYEGTILLLVLLVAWELALVIHSVPEAVHFLHRHLTNG